MGEFLDFISDIKVVIAIAEIVVILALIMIIYAIISNKKNRDNRRIK